MPVAPAGTPATTSIGRVVSVSTDGTLFTPVSNITKYSYGGSKANYSDITNSNSPVVAGSNAVAIERLPTTLDSGTFTIDLIANASDAGQTQLLAAFQSQILLHVKDQDRATGVQTAGPSRTYTAYVSKAPIPDGSITEANTFTVEFTITGLIAINPATTS